MDERGHGTVAALQGHVVDIRFAVGLPPLRQKLVAGERGAGVLEVASHLDTVRCIPLAPTRGLCRRRRRQEAITEELLDIVTGFEASR